MPAGGYVPELGYLGASLSFFTLAWSFALHIFVAGNFSYPSAKFRSRQLATPIEMTNDLDTQVSYWGKHGQAQQAKSARRGAGEIHRLVKIAAALKVAVETAENGTN